jgi:hypothetical protein
MAYDKDLLNERNRRIRADYNRLKAEEIIIKNRSETAVIRLHYRQILEILKHTHCISIRRLEAIISATAPVMAPITTGAPAQVVATA